MTDKFKRHAAGMTDPIYQGIELTPSDTADLPFVSRAIYVGAAGDLQVTLVSGQTVTFVAAHAGWHPVRATRVWATGTTASWLVGCA